MRNQLQRWIGFPLFCLTVATAAPSLCAGVARDGDTYVVGSSVGGLRFSARDGSILGTRGAGNTEALWRGGEDGLWSVRLRDNAIIRAAAADGGAKAATAFRAEIDPAGEVLHMCYDAQDLAVIVTVRSCADGVELSAQLSPRKQEALEIALPGRLRFDPDRIERLVAPISGGRGVGMALRPAFFKLQPEDPAAGWTPKVTGPKAYAHLYGGPLMARPYNEPEVALKATDAGREWLGETLAKRASATTARVVRPPAKGQADLVLIDSPNGAYFSASHLNGGAGLLWRVGGLAGRDQATVVQETVAVTINRLINDPAAAGAGRTKVGVLALNHGPSHGGACDVSVLQWVARLGKLKRIAAGQARLIELTSPVEIKAAASGKDFLAILNPYGESLPPIAGDDILAAVDVIGGYVRSGGNWFEVGGYPFHAILHPLQYLKMEMLYPPAFADFTQIEAPGAASVAMFGVRAKRRGPWEAAADPAATFVPGSFGCGGDARGGYVDHGFPCFVKPGETWSTPVVRFVFGRDVYDNLKEYTKANGIERRLEDKVPSPTLLDRFKRAVLVYYAGSAQEKLDHLAALPVPTLIHFADYLNGGFDKQYPDHLPPIERFGTPQQFRAFIDEAHKRGHLVMPYTNPTWWCDHPRGPSFEAAGEAPLLKGLDGKPRYEKYSANDGWTITFWHPAVRAANRKTVRQFTDEYPMDALFQDQCGARTWQYDTNPASPTPLAYVEGILSMVDEDSRDKPLGTENGFDAVANHQTWLTGMSWGIVPTEHPPVWNRMLTEEYPANTWEIFPMAQAIAHDKTLMIHHDLGQFVTNPQVLSWTLALGYAMSDRASAAGIEKDEPRQWLCWLDRVQQVVCARYAGQPIKAWKHERHDADGKADTISATYGPVRILANLGPEQRSVEGHELEAYGFYAAGEGFVAADLVKASGAGDAVPFIVSSDARRVDVWVYTRGERRVAVELPQAIKGWLAVQWDAVGDARFATEQVACDGSSLSLHVPAPANRATRYVWHATLTRQ